MKKKNVILLAGIISVAMLGGCGEKTSQEDSTNVMQEETIAEETEKTETTEETETAEETEKAEETETAEETTEVEKMEEELAKEEEKAKEIAEEAQETAYNEEFASVMAEIYGVNGDAAKTETVAETFKNFAFANGALSSSTVFETLANEWFQTMEATEGKDIRGEFSETFNNVTTTAQSKDETLEYDVAYLNVVNGILAAIGDVQGESTTEESTETNAGEENEFTKLMSEIYKVNTDSASAETVAENFKNYAFANGTPSSSTVFESMATEWFNAMEAKEGKDIRAEFSDAFNTVTTTAQSKDETLEFDVAYLNVVNGIFAAIGQ